MLIVVCLVTWLVLSAAVGVFVGTAIHRAQALELRRVPRARPAQESPRSEPAAMPVAGPMPVAVAVPVAGPTVPASPSGLDLHPRAWAA